MLKAHCRSHTMANVCRETAYTCGAESQQLANQVVEEVVTEQVALDHEQVAASGQLSEQMAASGQIITTEEIDTGEVVELIQVEKRKYQKFQISNGDFFM